MTQHYPAHPAAALLPLLPDDELARLAEDIRSNGLREPIVLSHGKVLDGRNRLAACALADVKPRFTDYQGSDPIDYVLSANVHRRHLTAGQRAMVAVALLPKLEARARARQGARTDLRADSPEGGRRARDFAARAVGVSPRSVADAKRLTAEAPELAAEVRAGTSSLNAAMGRLPSARLGDLTRAAAALEDAERERAEAEQLTERIRESYDKHRAAMRPINASLGHVLAYRLYEQDGLSSFREAVYAVFGEASYADLLRLAELGQLGEDGLGLAPWIAGELLPR